jgi:hypothetical protein
MSKTFKDKSEKYQDSPKKEKAKEGRRFVPSKGRKNINLKNLIRKGYDLDDV